MRILINYGYDIHSLEISDLEWQAIQSGKHVGIEGQGFWVEGEYDQDYWSFNSEKGSLGINCESGLIMILIRLGHLGYQR